MCEGGYNKTYWESFFFFLFSHHRLSLSDRWKAEWNPSHIHFRYWSSCHFALKGYLGWDTTHLSRVEAMAWTKADWSKRSPYYPAGKCRSQGQNWRAGFPCTTCCYNALTAEAILGLDFLKKNNSVIDMSWKVLMFSKPTMSISFSYQCASPRDVSKTRLMLVVSIYIPAYNEMERWRWWWRPSHLRVGDPGSWTESGGKKRLQWLQVQSYHVDVESCLYTYWT